MEEETARTLIVSIAAVLVTIGLFTYSSCVYTPLKMAEKGYCWRTVNVPAVAGLGGTSYSAYVPCEKSKDVTPVAEAAPAR